MPLWGDPAAAEARALGAICGGVQIWSLYVPNGRALGDPHLDYKVAWLEALRAEGARWLAERPDAQIALTGDWNIAPRDEDVWNMDAFAHSTHVSPPERAAFDAVVESGYADLVRPFAPGPGVYTYWDYVRLRFPRAEGMRIDFVLGSPALTRRVTGAMIDRDERKGKGASDHAPVIVDLAD
jgi:exodeoxyribonuclease-3